MQTQHTLSRDLTVFDITMIGVGAMIGAGIFVLTGEAAGTAGPALILSFALNGIVTIFTAMVYAELGSAIPEAGGGYLWVKEGLPGASAFLAGWMSWFAHAVAGALYALGFGAFLYELLRHLHAAVPLGVSDGQKAFGVGIVLVFAYINYRGAGETGLAGNIVTLAKVGLIGIFCLLGLKFMFFPDWWFSAGSLEGGMATSRLTPFIPSETGWAGIFSAMGLTFIAFEGYEIIVQAGEEVKDPRRNIPRAVFWSLAIVVPIYMLVAFVLVGASDAASLLASLKEAGQSIPAGLTADSENWKVLKHVGELGLARTASQFIPYGALLILGGGVLSTMSALNATTFSSTRVSFAMGRDRNLPDHFSYISPKRRTPAAALAWTAALICLMVAFVPLTTVAAAADIMFLLLFLQVNVAVITIRKKYGAKLAYGYLMPFFPIVPILGIATKLGLALFMFDHYPIAWLYVILWLSAGFLIFRLYASGRERRKAAPPILAEQYALDVRTRSVVVAVANPKAAKSIVRLGAKLSEHRDCGLVLLHVVRVPHQLPQRAATRFVNEAQHVLQEAQRQAEPFEVPVSSVIRTGEKVWDAVIHTAHDKNAEFVIMGWKGPRRRADTQIGRNIDKVLRDSNANALVVTGSVDPTRVSRVLVPVADPRNAGLAVFTAAVMAAENPNPEVVVLHLSKQPSDEKAKQQFLEALTGLIARNREHELPTPSNSVDLKLEFRQSSFVIFDLAEYSKEFDLLILGTSRGGLFGRKVFGRIPTRIAEEAKCPVILVRPKARGLRFEVQRFFQFFRELED